MDIARDKGKYDVVSLLQEHIRKRSRSKLPQKPESPKARNLKLVNLLIIFYKMMSLLPMARHIHREYGAHCVLWFLE